MRAHFALLLVHHSGQTDTEGEARGLHDSHDSRSLWVETDGALMGSLYTSAPGGAGATASDARLRVTRGKIPVLLQNGVTCVRYTVNLYCDSQVLIPNQDR